MKETVPTFRPTSERLWYIRLKERQRNINILNVYVPTEEAEEDKDIFYEQMDQEYERIQKHDVTVILGDWNAKIEKKGC